jgi:hypothetical protein
MRGAIRRNQTQSNDGDVDEPEARQESKGARNQTQSNDGDVDEPEARQESKGAREQQ